MDIERQDSALEGLRRISGAFVNQQPLDELLTLVAQEAASATDAENAVVSLIDESRRFRVYRAVHGALREPLLGLRRPATEGIHGWAMRERRTAVVANAAIDPRVSERGLEIVGASSMICTPLLVRDTAIGTLAVINAPGHPSFDQQHASRLELFAAQAAVAIENARLFAESERRAARLAALNAVGQVLLRERNLDAVLTRLLGELQRVRPFRDGALLLSEPDGGALRVLAAVGSPEMLKWIGATWPSGRGILGRVARTGASVILPDVTLDPDYYPGLTDTASEACLALKSGSRIIGVLNIEDNEVGAFTAEDSEIFRAFADLAALAIENARLHESERRRSDLLELVYETTQELTSGVDLSPLLHLITMAAIRLLDGNGGSVYLVENGFLRLAESEPPGLIDRYGNVRLQPGEGVAGRVALTGKPFSVSDYTLFEGKADIYRHETSFGAVLAVPLLWRGEVVGVLDVLAPAGRQFSEIDVHVLTLFAGQAAIAAGYARLYDEERARARALAESEARSRAIMDSSHDLIYVLDMDGRFTFMNSAVMEVLGYRPEELLGRGFGDYIVDEDYTAALRNFQAAASGAITSGQADRRVRHKDGHTVILEVSITVLKVGERNLGIQGIARDVTEHRRLQQDFLQSEKLRALGTLASGVAHDFNNLLGLILGHAEVTRLAMQRGHVNQQTILGALQRIEQAAGDGATIAARLQDFTRRGTDVGAGLVVDLLSIATEVVELTRPRWQNTAQASGHTVTVQVQGSPGAWVTGNPGELREALTNLVLNALDALPAGGVIDLVVYVDGSQVCLKVRDNGTGIPPEVLPRIFDPFFSTKGPSGHGLGLSMVYGIVHRHNGEITVDSTLGTGTVFTIRLPLTAAAELPAAAEGTASPGGLQVLVLDDEVGLADVLANMLELEGHTPTVAHDGMAALQMLDRHHFDAMFTDLSMPEMNGWEVLEQAHDRFPELPVVLVTGWGREIDMEEARARGALTVVSKPYRLVDIAATIEQITPVLRK